MRKAFLTLLCMAAMLAAGTGLKAQEVSITLIPGWTWISNPSTDTLDFATVLGSFTPMTGDAIKSQWGNASYRNGHWAGSISQFYPGYGYKYYSNRTMPVTLTFNAQQPSSQVVVTTSEPMLITAISAMGGGEVTTNDGTYILVKGLCWATHENPTTNDDFFEEAESGVGSFSLLMTGLNISTTYYVRAYAVTADGTYYGDQKTFTTRDGIPTLTTDSVVDITGATATCGGNITDNGGLNVIARGVCWSTSPNPIVADSYTTNGSGIGSFSSSITGLNISTIYYVRAYATTATGTAYGNEKTFTTRDGIPSVTTADVTGIMAESATCGGTVTDNCGLTVIARGICWSTSPTPTLDDSHTTNGSGNGSFSSSITGLNLSTTYYVRAYATTSAGTAYGEEKTFTTRNGIPTLTTAEITNIGSRWAYSGGNIADDGGLPISAKGVCWSISPNPTLADPHTTDGSGAGSYTSYINGLNLNTTYYLRAYATNSIVTVYGNQLSFTTENNTPTGAINGLFSVSTSQQVYFSQGNLQYQASTNIWKFADNQWDCIGEDNNNISPTYNGWIDLFGWGTSGYNHGAICYQPWSMSRTDSDYFAYGGENYNLYDQTGQADWGYNAISNGGYATNSWRTLTGGSGGEWDYVFNIRSTTSGIRYAKAQVNGVNGVILLPDDWSGSYYSLSNTNQSNADFDDNVVNSSIWTNSFEAHGAVFLPSSGRRSGTSTFHLCCGYYWSATHNNWSTMDSYRAYIVLFTDDTIKFDSDTRYMGYSVRLVRN